MYHEIIFKRTSYYYCNTPCCNSNQMHSQYCSLLLKHLAHFMYLVSDVDLWVLEFTDFFALAHTLHATEN